MVKDWERNSCGLDIMQTCERYANLQQIAAYAHCDVSLRVVPRRKTTNPSLCL